MSNVELLPEMRTNGGEALSIYRDGDWIGDMYLIYRENDLLTGSIHVDHLLVESEEIDAIVEDLRSYIRNLSYALNVVDSSVNIIYGSYSLLEDFDDDLELVEDDETDSIGYERWIVGQGERGIEYQIYNDDQDLVAEAVVDIKGTRIFGDINFTFEPSEQEMEDIEAMLLKDYDHDLIDQYNFTYTINGSEYQEIQVEPAFEEDDEEFSLLDEDEEDEVIGMLERQETEDDYEQRERAEVIFDLVDKQDNDLGQATFYYSEDGVDVTIDLGIQPHEEVTHHLMKMVFKEALTDPMEWVNIRMYYKGQVIDGFHFERGKEMQQG
jgi:hypothetical protein